MLVQSGAVVANASQLCPCGSGTLGQAKVGISAIDFRMVVNSSPRCPTGVCDGLEKLECGCARSPAWTFVNFGKSATKVKSGVDRIVGGA